MHHNKAAAQANPSGNEYEPESGWVSTLPRYRASRSMTGLRRLLEKSRLYFSPTVPWIVLLGLDGSGKSTVLAEMEKIFSAGPYLGTRLFYRHPGYLYARWLENHRRSVRGKPQPGVVQHYAKPPHNRFKSVAKLTISALDWLAGYWGRVKPARAGGYLILFDRHFLVDLEIDPLRYRFLGSPRLVHFVRRVLPGPDMVILLDASVAVLHGRKQETSAEETARQRAAYLELIRSRPDAFVVDASQPLEAVINDVYRLILDGSSPAGKTAG